MDLMPISYLIGFSLLILIISRFMIGDNFQSMSHTPLQKNINRDFYYSSESIMQTNVNSDFRNVIDFLENEVNLRYGKNKIEKDYQDDLFQAFGILRERYGYEIKYESKNGRHRVDFSVNDNIGIELKVHRNGVQVKKELFNQITDYANYYQKMIAVVINVNENDTSYDIKNDICCKLRQQNVISETNYYIVVLTIVSR